MHVNWIMTERKRKNKMTMTKQDRICMISLFAVMLVLMGVPALCLSTNTVVDELGTLTNTALLTGRNWGTGILSNGGYYYRYGMAFVWLLPFLIFKDPIIVYKAASFVNALFMATTPVMAYYIGRRYLKLEKEKDAALLAAGSAIISSVMFQAIYLRGDMMLIVLNWVCALFILNAMYAKTKKRASDLYDIAEFLCSVRLCLPQQGNRYGDCLCDDCTADPVFYKGKGKKDSVYQFLWQYGSLSCDRQDPGEVFQACYLGKRCSSCDRHPERNAETADKGNGDQILHSDGNRLAV